MSLFPFLENNRILVLSGSLLGVGYLIYRGFNSSHEDPIIPTRNSSHAPRPDQRLSPDVPPPISPSYTGPWVEYEDCSQREMAEINHLVRQRVRRTYTYLAGGLAIVGGTTIVLVGSGAVDSFMQWMVQSAQNAVVSSSPSLASAAGTRLTRRAMAESLTAALRRRFTGLALVLSGASFASLYAIMRLPRSQAVLKHAAWVLFNLLMAGGLAPLVRMAGPLAGKALLILVCLCSGLSLLVAATPSRRFLSWEGPLAIGLLGLTGTSIGQWIWPNSTFLADAAAIGGVVLFSLYFLHDFDRLRTRAAEGVITEVRERDRVGGDRWDAMAESMSMYLDVVNLFTYILKILMQNEERKRRLEQQKQQGNRRRNLEGDDDGDEEPDRPSRL